MAKVYANKSKKDGKVLSYYTVAFIGEFEDGRPYQKKVSIKVSDLPPGTPTTPTAQKNAAELALKNQIVELRADFQRTHSTEDKNQITLAEFIDRHWWPNKVMNGKKSPNTIAFYEDQVPHIKAFFKGKKLYEIGTEDIIRFNNYQRTKAVKSNGEPISQSTAAHRYSTLRAVLNYAYRTEYISKNPIEKLDDDDKVVQEKHEVFHLTEDEIKAFEQMLEDYAADYEKHMEGKDKHLSGKYWQVYFLIALRCGLRRGEIIPLRWNDITVTIDGKASIYVGKTIVRDTSKPDKMTEKKPKKEKTRHVPIPDNLYQLILTYQKEQKENGFSTTGTAYVFPRESDPDKSMYPTTPTQRLRKLEQKYGTTDASVHDLRHSAGSTMARNGIPIKVISKVLGHSDIRTTDAYYIGTDDDQVREAVNTTEKIG